MHPARAGRIVLGEEAAPGFGRFLVLFIIMLYALYGCSMGLFRGAFPAAVSAIKMPLLFLLTVGICYPSLYAVNCVFGSKVGARGCARLLLLSVSANAIALASYAPFSFFFALTTSRQGYGFLILMHVGVLGLAGVASLAVVVRIFVAISHGAGRSMHPVPFLLWGALYAATGVQMSWVLRPWIGTWSQRYEPFRPLGGSFYEAVWSQLRGIL